MRKRKAPIAAVFFLALLIAIVGMYNMQSATSAPPGVYDAALLEEQAHRHEAEAAAAGPSDAERRGAMSEQLGGPLAPGANSAPGVKALPDQAPMGGPTR